MGLLSLHNQMESRGLPEPLKFPTLKEFKAHGRKKKQAMTGCEAAEYTASQAECTVSRRG
jgi:hypothetical protein